MAATVLKVSRIGNSRGIRLPAAMLRKYRIGDTILAEETAHEIILRAPGPRQEKLSWEETYRAMAAAAEDWSEWDSTLADGLADVPWNEDKPGHSTTGKRRRVSQK